MKQKHLGNPSVKFMTILDKNQTQIGYSLTERKYGKRIVLSLAAKNYELTSDPDPGSSDRDVASHEPTKSTALRRLQTYLRYTMERSLD